MKAAELLGVGADQCIALEDSPTGLASAVAAGWHAVGIPNIIALPEGPRQKIVGSLTDLTAANLETLRIHD